MGRGTYEPVKDCPTGIVRSKSHSLRQERAENGKFLQKKVFFCFFVHPD